MLMITFFHVYGYDFFPRLHAYAGKSFSLRTGLCFSLSPAEANLKEP